MSAAGHAHPVQLVEASGILYGRTVNGEVLQHTSSSWRTIASTKPRQAIKISDAEPLLTIAASNKDVYKLRQTGEILRYTGRAKVWESVQHVHRAVGLVATEQGFYCLVETADGAGTSTAILSKNSGHPTYQELEKRDVESKARIKQLQAETDRIAYSLAEKITSLQGCLDSEEKLHIDHRDEQLRVITKLQQDLMKETMAKNMLTSELRKALEKSKIAQQQGTATANVEKEKDGFVMVLKDAAWDQ